MGASGSVLPDTITGDLKEYVELTERQKNKIAEWDAAMIEAETMKMFKGHNKIIDELTARSKKQIKRLLLNTPNSVKHLDSLAESGNQYAKFIKQLAADKAELEMEAIKATSEGYDEELLINIIGTATTKELQQLDELYTKEFGFSLRDIFESQCKKDSTLLQFVQRVLRFDRDESKVIDQQLAKTQAEILHKAGAARLMGVDETPIIEILASASRAQFYAINEAYQAAFNMKLERAINMKFKGNCGKIMLMWSQSIPNAVVACLHNMTQKMIIDKNMIGLLLARYDKDTLSMADAACKEQHKKPLGEYLSGALSGGSFQRAIKGWIENPSPDKGFERILHLYLESKLAAGMTIESIANDQELRSKMIFLLTKQGQEMKLFMIDHKIKVDPADQALLSNSSNAAAPLGKSVANMNLSQSKANLLQKKEIIEAPMAEIPESPEAEAEEEKVVLPARRKFSIIKTTNKKDVIEVTESDVNRVYAYLSSVLEKNDTNASGSLPTDVFWSTIENLPLKELGYTTEEISLVKATSDWDNDGLVYYYEAMMEFSESVANAIVEKETGDRHISRVIERLTENNDVAMNKPMKLASQNFDMNRGNFVSMSGRRGYDPCPNVPVYFRQYIMDTLWAFDFDCNHYLTSNELTSLIQTLNIPSLTLESFLKNGVRLSVCPLQTLSESNQLIYFHFKLTD